MTEERSQRQTIDAFADGTTIMMWKAITLILATVAAVGYAARAKNRSIHMLNDSGSKIEVYWVNPETAERHLMSKSPVLFGATFPLNTFVGHEFELRELPSVKTGVCKSPDQTCRQASFVISENDDQGKIPRNDDLIAFSQHILHVYSFSCSTLGGI